MRRLLILLPLAVLLTAARPAVTGTLDGPTPANPAYGDTVAFDVTVDGKLGPKDRVFVRVVCVQGAVGVFQQSSWSDYAFTLTDTVGLEWDGGPADCSAELIHKSPSGKGTHGKGYTLTTLDRVTFGVSS